MPHAFFLILCYIGREETCVCRHANETRTLVHTQTKERQRCMNPSSRVSPRTDWIALASCCLASFVLSTILLVFGALVVQYEWLFHFSDTLHTALGIDILWLFSGLVVIGTPTALLLSGVGLFRTRANQGRKGRIFALLGLVFSLCILAILAYVWFGFRPLQFGPVEM